MSSRGGRWAHSPGGKPGSESWDQSQAEIEGRKDRQTNVWRSGKRVKGKRVGAEVARRGMTRGWPEG